MQGGAKLQAQVEEAVRGFQGPDNELLCFPMSLGDPCMDKDHSGEPCTVLDVVYATQVLHMAETSRHALTWLIAPLWPEHVFQYQLEALQ